MPETRDLRSYGAVFDTVAVEYDRNRPTYPDELIDRAVALGGLEADDRVLEIGCGSGQLTRGLVARGLHVTAIEPGENLIALAEHHVNGPGSVQFVNGRLEDASPDGEFAAAFSASAFHWIDPDVSWGKVEQLIEPGGLVALIQYCGVRDERTAADEDALLSVLAEVAPEIAADWPELRDLDTFLTGAEERKENVSEVWAWVGSQPVARRYAAALFDDVELAVVPAFLEQTAEELNALVRTLSLYHRMSPAQQQALERGNLGIEEQLGRPIRSSLVAVLVTARRAGAPA